MNCAPCRRRDSLLLTIGGVRVEDHYIIATPRAFQTDRRAEVRGLMVYTHRAVFLCIAGSAVVLLSRVNGRSWRLPPFVSGRHSLHAALTCSGLPKHPRHHPHPSRQQCQRVDSEQRWQSVSIVSAHNAFVGDAIALSHTHARHKCTHTHTHTSLV